MYAHLGGLQGKTIDRSSGAFQESKITGSKSLQAAVRSLKSMAMPDTDLPAAVAPWTSQRDRARDDPDSSG